MAQKAAIVGLDGEQVKSNIPRVKAVHPFGSKILIETISPSELMSTTLIVSDTADNGDAPQAYVIELGPQVPAECGLKVGDRIYWEGKGMAIDDPRVTSEKRVRAFLEVHNIRGIIEEA